MKRLISTAAAMACLYAGAALAATPVETHGALHVDGTHVVDAHGAPVALSGVSFFWDNTGWGEERFYNAGAVKTFARDWHASLIRAAMGVDAKGGYLDDPHGNEARVDTLVKAAIHEGIYVIIDWHSHHAHEKPEAAVAFFTRMAGKYGKYPNVIYELYNEPLNTTDWHGQVKPYAETVIDAIRKVDANNLIVVGSPTWDQDVDVAAADPIAGRNNIVYSLHFYAGTHKDDLRKKAAKAIALGAPLFVSEWGSVNADGNGGVDVEETARWQQFMADNCLSQANWAVSDKNEGAAMFIPGTRADGHWRESDLTASGKLTRDIVRAAPQTCR
ncbi:glycoside hydrolase family 5 protein [Asticcacaulis solisilvae]|uniref:glycoside hydrolase family 5 protein n=1 Tax=Asticcacaulis solisilvae TaxID=1217274 RepID=UPI003FD76D0F